MYEPPYNINTCHGTISASVHYRINQREHNTLTFLWSNCNCLQRSERRGRAQLIRLGDLSSSFRIYHWWGEKACRWRQHLMRRRSNNHLTDVTPIQFQDTIHSIFILQKSKVIPTEVIVRNSPLLSFFINSIKQCKNPCPQCFPYICDW